MIKEAFTARELAELKLQGWPHTKRGFTKKLADQSSRPRQGAGGGREFPFADLPPALQVAILEAAQGVEKTISAAADTPDTDKRFLARAAIVTEFRAYCRRYGLKLTAAEPGFIAMYKAQAASHADAPFPRWVFDVYPSFSVASLRNWRAKASDPSDLKDSYGNRKGQSILARANDGKVAEAIEALICEKHLISAGHIRDIVRIDFGTFLRLDDERTVPLPKIRAFERFIEGWKKDNPEKFMRATNPDGWRNKYMLALGKADAEVTRLNQRWEIDASPMDVLCPDGRYLIYALVDVWSRRLMIHVSRTATTEGSLALIRRACLEWGMPESIKTDNGSDFTSKRFKEALFHLGIEQPVAAAFSPWKKAYVERAIKTFQHDFAPVVPGFIGHSVADRKKIEGVKSFADNLGADKAARFNVELTAAELQTHINNWVDGHYHQRPHSGINDQTPFMRFTQSPIKPRLVRDVRALDVLLAPVAGLRRVGKKAIRVEGAHFYHDTLLLHMGKDVFVRLDPDDMGKVYVFDTNHKFICEAKNYDRMGADRAEVASAAKQMQRKHINEELAEIKKTARKEYSPGKLAEKMFSDAAQAAARVTAFPKQTEVYTTPSLDEAARAGRKEQIVPDRTEERKALQEAIVKDLATYQQRQKPQTDEERWWQRAKELEARIEAGETLSAEEQSRLDHAQTTGWYRSMTEHERLKKELNEGV